METINTATNNVRDYLSNYMLADGMNFTLDLANSKGSYLRDATNNRDILDFFTFFATAAIGHNHPSFYNDEEFKKNILETAIMNPSNSDFYTEQYAKFIEVFAPMAMGDKFKYSFFISGGALAVENALKVAMDWKVQKNIKNGISDELGHQVIHFKQAFHGRSGYTLSLTNTSPDKTRNFKMFDWPRITNPKIVFPMEENLDSIIESENEAVNQIKQAFADNKDDICSIILEPIQGEGGDNHFRKEFFQQLRDLADENEAMLIFDEVQTGVGLTGKFWAFEHYGVTPDLIAFGKKMQVCGILSTDRVDEVEDNCFQVSSRINSTWGGSLTDMVRATKILQVIEEDGLIDNAAKQGNNLVDKLNTLKSNFDVSNVRGQGLMCSFDMPNTETRNKLLSMSLENDMLLLGCGDQSVRFRPSLIVNDEELSKAVSIIEKCLGDIL